MRQRLCNGSSARSSIKALLIASSILMLAFGPTATGSTCDENYSLTTGDVGQGLSCWAATNNLIFLLQGQFSCASGTCAEELVITEPCTRHFGVAWTVWGHIRYKCMTGACASSQAPQGDQTMATVESENLSVFDVVESEVELDASGMSAPLPIDHRLAVATRWAR